MRTRRITCIVLGVSALLAPLATADEGMWLLTNPPRQQLQERFGFDPSPEFLEHMQKSAVRFGGASGSLISPNGLVLTNHHVGRGAIGKLSSAERDLIADGYYAKTSDDELPCVDTEVTILWSIQDVTEEVDAAAADAMTSAEAATARRKAMANIEQRSEDATGLHSRVITLYGGGQYHLYRSKRFTDVRLVFAPEQGIASFGGDIDNFEYPRFCADFALFRIYENGKPLQNEHYLGWSEPGADDGDLALIFGHPGSTARLDTVADLEFTRDLVGPRRLSSLMRREVELQSFMGRSAEHRRIGQTRIKGVANGRKGWTGYMGGLMDPALMKRKRADEARLRAAHANGSSESDPWQALERAFASYESYYLEQSAINGLFFGGLSGTARTLVRMSDELPKPSGERLREYRDTALPSLERRLYSSQPIYDILEINGLTSSLTDLMWTLGGDHPIVKTALGGLSPRRRAEQLILGSNLADIDERKRLAEGGAAAIASSDDPLIQFALALDPRARELRTRSEDEVEAVEREAYAQIATAKFALDGESVYPDATSSLRMSFGAIRGWEEVGEAIEPFTSIGGLFERARLRAGHPEFSLPESWARAESRLDLDTPMNFVCMGDVIGGNSGSPIVNRDGEVIGLVFDGNLHMLVGRYAYDERTNRTIAVDARSIIESLQKVYGADRIVNEILND